MKKSFTILCILFCFGASVYFGYFLGTHKGDSGVNISTQSTNLSGSERTPSVTNIAQQALLFGNMPMSKTDCEKKSSSPEQEACFFALAVRGARDASDITRCKGLKDQARCEKIITEEFSREFMIPPMMQQR